MSLKKFRPNDVIVNTMKAHPRCEFFIWNASVYYNNVGYNSGAFSQHSKNVPTGSVSLYEYNVDRISGSTSYSVFSSSTAPYGQTDNPGLNPDWPAGVPNTPRPTPGGYIDTAGARQAAATTNPFIFPYITKDSERVSFRTVGTGSMTSSYWKAESGDILFGSYPMSASITREFILNDETGSEYGGQRFKNNKHYRALRNKLNFLGARSDQYKISSPGWNKDHQRMALISIPSIFYGSQIKPGSVSLRWYMTGTLCGELRDINQNGELIQVSGGIGTPGFSAGDLTATKALQCTTGSVAGVVLYDEGFLLLTGSWPLTKETITLIPGAISASSDNPGNSQAAYPLWVYWGVGCNDGANTGSMDNLYGRYDTSAARPLGTGPGDLLSDKQFNSASFGLTFQGTTKTQVVTMFAHAKRGEVNYSNNPTYLQYSQSALRTTSSHVYEENPNRLIKNTVSSSFAAYSSSFERQVFISKVALYDNNKNLIGVATLANPVRKKEDEYISFKMRIDI
jgi:hypothetical protein